METTSNQTQFSSTAAPLSEPHFDDEATVLSARPVVPLERVNPKSRLTRPWLFSGAVGAALLLGILVTATYYSRSLRRPDFRLAANAERIGSGVEAGAAEKRGDTAASPHSTEGAFESAAQARSKRRSTIEPPASSSEISKRPVARRVAVITYKSHLREEQQRTRGQRERRYNSPDDLTRIREIFEGPRKP